MRIVSGGECSRRISLQLSPHPGHKGPMEILSPNSTLSHFPQSRSLFPPLKKGNIQEHYVQIICQTFRKSRGSSCVCVRCLMIISGATDDVSLLSGFRVNRVKSAEEYLFLWFELSSFSSGLCGQTAMFCDPNCAFCFQQSTTCRFLRRFSNN